jgi:hypothetical protein
MRLFQAGPVQVYYDQGFLRYLSLGGKEVVRMIYFAVRNQDWNTIAGAVEEETVEQSEEAFRIGYQYHVQEGNIRMRWLVSIAGTNDGTISFAIQGSALSTFLKNRVGLCVLHPIEGVAGQICRIGHPDGSYSASKFPELVSPHQPFLNIQSMEWPVGEEGRVRLDFEGEVFETEDQRNWTDTSYKTYCTPLAQPFPVEVPEGTVFQQKVTFRVVQPPVVSARSAPAGIQTEINGPPLPFPAVGVGMSAEGTPPTEAEAAFLRKISLSHLRADLFLSQSDWVDRLQEALSQSHLLHLPLELALFFGPDPEVEANALLPLLLPNQPQLASLLIFEGKTRLTSPALLAAVVPLVREKLPGTKVGGGTDANFAEFNRNPFPFLLVDYVSYSANPQAHATDDLILIENMAAQGDTVRSARVLAPGLPVHVSPVTLKSRFNAVATSGSSSPSPPADHRQATSLVAGWSLGSLKYLAEAGVSSVTYFETTGPGGIYSGDQPFAVGQFLAYLGQFNPGFSVPTTCNRPLLVSSLLIQNGAKACLLLANHTTEEQVVELPKDFVPEHSVAIDTSAAKEIFSAETLFIELQPEQVMAIEGFTGAVQGSSSG